MTQHLATRRMNLDATRADNALRSVPATLSSTFPVRRGNVSEVLLHGPDNVDLSRAPLPLIESHDANRLPIGRVDNLRIDGNKLRGDLVFGSSSRANEIWQDVKTGIVRHLSIGYEILNDRSRGNVIEVTRWQPVEASLVAIPADPQAGTFRSFTPMNRDNIDNTDNNDNGNELQRLSRSQRRAVSADQNATQLATQDERSRIMEITAMCATHGQVPGVRELERSLIDEGCSVQTARQYVLDRIREHGKLSRSYGSLGNPAHADDAQRPFSIVRAIGSFLDPRMDAGLERETSQEIARRVGRQPEGIYVPLGEMRQRAFDYAAGQPVVPPAYLPDSFIDALRARSFVMRLGTRVLPDLVGNVSVPRLATGQTASWIAGDGVDGLPTTQPAFDSVTLSPKTIGALCVITRRMILQALPSAEQLVRDDFAKLIAAELDKAAIAGTGTTNQPRGIVNIAGIGTGTYPLAGPDYPSVVAMEGGLMAANADAASIAYLTTPQLAAALKAKEKASGSGLFVWNAGREPGVGEMGGLPAYASSNVPVDKIILGNFSDLLMGMWGAIDVSVDPNYDFAKGSIAVRIFASVDFAVRHPQSFVVYGRGSV